jgi:hypothetical protein
MINEWRGFLLDRAPEWKLPQDGEWTFLFHNNYHSHHSNINVLWFHNGDEFPRVVTKVFRQPEIPTREFANLNEAYQRVPQWTPEPLHCGLQGDFWMLWMSGVPGVRFWNNSPVMLQSLVEMITGFHQTIRQHGGSPDTARYGNLISRPLDTLTAFGPSAAVREGCEQLRAQASVKWLASQGVIPQHGDLYIDNVLRATDRWYLIDWENYGAIDLPFYDLLTCLLSCLRTSGETPEQWDRAFVRSVPGLVSRYAGKLDLTVSQIRLLLPLAFANWFHLHWSDGRQEFTTRMYRTIQHYFEHKEQWEKVFLPV